MMNDGKTWSDVGQATRQVEQIVTDAGLINRASFRWAPRAGIDRKKVHFLNLYASESMKQRIINANMLSKAKAWDKIRKINDPVMSCQALGLSRYIKLR